MRTKNALRNTIFSLGGYLLVFVFGILVRKLFIQNLDFSNLGYEGLFGNIFSLLAVSDLGIGSLLTYRLYAALAQEDAAEVRRLMAMFKKLYAIIAAGMFVLGLCIMPFLRYLIKDEITDWGYVYFLYLAQLAGYAGMYLMAYRRTFMVANQRGFEVARIETILRIVSQILKVVAMLWLKSYIAYMLISIFANLATNFIIWLRCRKAYPTLLNGSCTRADFEETGLKKEIRASAYIQIVSSVYEATDSILISLLIGIRTVAAYGNYTMIGFSVQRVFQELLQPVASSVGNYVNLEEPENSFRLFKALNLCGFLCASFAFTSYCVLFQPAVTLLYGEAYLLPDAFVLFYALFLYMMIKACVLRAFRGALGLYDKEKAYFTISSLLNLVLSIVLGMRIGITGVMIGTVVSEIVIWSGRYLLVCRHMFRNRGLRVLGEQAGYMALTLCEMALAAWLTRGFAMDWGGVALRALSCLVLPNALNLLLFCRTQAFKVLWGYVDKAFNVLKNRGNADA